AGEQRAAGRDPRWPSPAAPTRRRAAGRRRVAFRGQQRGRGPDPRGGPCGPAPPVELSPAGRFAARRFAARRCTEAVATVAPSRTLPRGTPFQGRLGRAGGRVQRDDAAGEIAPPHTRPARTPD